MQYSVKQEMKIFIKNNIPENELTKIIIPNSELTSSSSEFRQTDENEFIYKGKYYDVVRKKTIGDITIFYCINDSNEEKLFDELTEHVKQNTEQNAPLKNKSVQLLKNIIKEALPDKTNKFYKNQSISYISFTYISYFNKNYSSVFLPPPKF